MSGNWDNTLKGALFINKDKNSPNHPDYKGSLETEDGEEYWVSGWIKEIKNGAKAGQKFISIALTPKDNNQQMARAVNARDSDAQSFLDSNRDKIDAHRTRDASEPQRATPNPASDMDSFDDDIPF